MAASAAADAVVGSSFSPLQIPLLDEFVQATPPRSPRAPVGDSSGWRPPAGGEEKVAVRELLLFLVREMEKQRHFQHFPLYILYLVILGTFVTYTADAFSVYSKALQMTNEARDTLAVPELMGMTTADAFWPWATNAVEGVWSGSSHDTSCSSREAVHNIPLGVFMIRQWRVNQMPCPEPPPLAPADRRRVPCVCMPEYTEDAISLEPYGPGKVPPWIPEASVGSPAHSVGVKTLRNHFKDTDKQFSVTLQLQLNKSEALDVLRTLHEEHWVDAATRLVVIDTLFLNPSTDQMAYMQTYLEILPSGVAYPGVHGRVFTLMKQSSSPWRVTMAVDVLVSAALPVFAYGLITMIQLRRRCDPGAFPYFGTVEVFEAGFIAALAIYVFARWQLRASEWDVTDRGDLAEASAGAGFGETEADQERFTFHRLAQHAELYEAARTRLAVLLVVSFLRTFKYFQHFTRLNMLTETVRRAFWELVRLLLIWFVILCGYAGGACVLYGADIEDFETVTSSFSFLVRILFQVGQDTEFSWKGMEEVAPQLTPWFMGSYYGLSFLLLLNMALAAIVSSFTQVQHARDEADRKDEKREGKLQQQMIVERSKTLQNTSLVDGSACNRLCLMLSDLRTTVSPAAKSIINRAMGRGEYSPQRHEDTVRQLKLHCESKLSLPIKELDAHPQLYKCLRVSYTELCDAVGGVDDTAGTTQRGLARVFWSTRRREIEQSDVLLHLYDGFERLCEMLTVFLGQRLKQPTVETRSEYTRDSGIPAVRLQVPPEPNLAFRRRRGSGVQPSEQGPGGEGERMRHPLKRQMSDPFKRHLSLSEVIESGRTVSPPEQPSPAEPGAGEEEMRRVVARLEALETELVELRKKTDGQVQASPAARLPPDAPRPPPDPWPPSDAPRPPTDVRSPPKAEALPTEPHGIDFIAEAENTLALQRASSAPFPGSLRAKTRARPGPTLRPGPLPSRSPEPNVLL
eukprot:Hpha_TRINITY_DN2685_c0_g1::TRINITY_DN2685_c0_g1_i1::g.145875::m.145875/K04986/PKD2; polycystin 2